MPVNIAVVGSYNVGLTIQLDRMPALGETLLGKDYIEGPGGKGSNQAVAASRLGANVHFISSVGEDHHGDDAFSLWTKEGIYHHVKRDDQNHTGVGMILLFAEGDNAILVAPGANNALSRNDLDALEDTIASCQILLVQLEILTDTVLHAIKLAKKHGLTVVLNPAPVQPLPTEIFPMIDVLTPNETEAKTLIGENSNADISTESLAQKLLELGTGAVVVTQGKAGAMIATQNNIDYVKAPQVTTVDPTGAGDAFNGALVVALAEGKTLKEAAQWACYGGAHCATALEVIPGLATRNQLETLIERHPYE